MYLEHFGLERPPFRITPDPRLFFGGGKRGAVLQALLYAIASGEGIVKVVGEVGSGKTMLCRMLATRLPPNVATVYIVNPNLSPASVLPLIAGELGLPASSTDRLQTLQLLHRSLLTQHADGRQVVVLVEEAQRMPLATLEEIRLLSNLETERSKLLQIVLFGQPELDARLARTTIRQLRERIGHQFVLAPLSAVDVQAYLNFRLRVAGYKGPDIFHRGSARLVRRHARGLVRRVNIIADKALLAAFADGAHGVRRAHVRRAARDSVFGSPRRWRVGPALAALLPCALLSAPLGYVANRTLDTPVAAGVRHAPLERSASAAFGRIVHRAGAAPSASPPPGRSEHTVRRWQERARQWLRRTPGGSYSIQVLTIARSRSNRLQAHLRSLAGLIELDRIYIYESGSEGNRLLAVLYDEYATRRDALAAIDALPEALRRNRPFPRAVDELRNVVKG